MPVGSSMPKFERLFEIPDLGMLPSELRLCGRRASEAGMMQMRGVGRLSADDLALGLQHALDRAMRRLRRGAAPARTRRRLLVVQIDGLSGGVLKHALASGRMPFLRSMVEGRGYRLQGMSVGLPTSTPAFQMAVFYGVRPDIPGFHYFDRERQADVHFPRRGHAALVEQKHAAGRRGILKGGSAYGCVFTGEADNSMFTFASITRPSGRGVLAALSPFVVVAWVCAKCAARTFVEVLRTMPPFGAAASRGQQSRKWFRIKVGISVWVREFFTMAASRDLYAGVPAVYVNYVDYDESAHAFGPRSRPALVSLSRVDRAIRQLARVARRVPEHQYDIYVLADHGQAACTPYRTLAEGKRFERWVFDRFLAPARAAATEAPDRSGLARGIGDRRRETRGLLQRFHNYIYDDYFRREDPEAHEHGGVRVISAGPNAFLYVLGERSGLDDAALAQRFPRLAEELSQSVGVGYVLARSADGPVCYWRGQRVRVREMEPGPFDGREDAHLVCRGIADLMNMPSAGDLVIYGTDTAHGHVSFIAEMGSHAGPSSEEMNTFVVHPTTVPFETPITHPVQLYEHFARYRGE